MALNGNQLARRNAGAIEMRPEPLRMRVRLSDLATGDVHCVDLAFGCSVAALDRRGEREMFAEVFLTDRSIATTDDVSAHFAAALNQAARGLLATQPAEHWLADASRKEIIRVLRDAGGKLAFACGVEMLPPFEAAVSSPSLAREKLEAAGRKLSERRVAGQVEHVQRAAGLLKQFESLREAMPNLSPGELLERVGETDRGSMLQSLLLTATSGATALLWAVAGPNVILFDPRQSSPRPQLIEVPTDLGPLRSVRPDDGGLLVGAQNGVMILDPTRPADAIRLRDAQTASALGFNSAAASGGVIWASHGESGVVAWRTAEPDAPAKAFRIALGARNLVALDDARILYSVAGDVWTATLDSEPRKISIGASPVMQLGVERHRAMVIRGDGTIERLDRETLEQIDLQKRCGEVSSAGVMPWLGSSRLLLATADGPICCVGLDDGVVTQYLSVHKGLRAVAACADTVAALSADRQRLVIWQTWAGEKPLAELHVGSLARHRAADVCFGCG